MNFLIKISAVKHLTKHHPFDDLLCVLIKKLIKENFDPPNNVHFFAVPRAVVIHRFDCIFILLYNDIYLFTLAHLVIRGNLTERIYQEY